MNWQLGLQFIKIFRIFAKNCSSFWQPKLRGASRPQPYFAQPLRPPKRKISSIFFFQYLARSSQTRPGDLTFSSRTRDFLQALLRLWLNTSLPPAISIILRKEKKRNTQPRCKISITKVENYNPRARRRGPIFGRRPEIRITKLRDPNIWGMVVA